MITVENRLKIYEIKGQETGPKNQYFLVKSHWNWNHFVTLVFEDQRDTGIVIDITVSAKDLQAAIVNSQNTGSR